MTLSKSKIRLTIFDIYRNPLWMLVNVTIFGDDALVEEMITALM